MLNSRIYRYYKEVKKIEKWRRISRFARLTATATHIPYGITQCYLPPGRGDIPAFTPAEAGIDLATPEGCKAELT